MHTYNITRFHEKKEYNTFTELSHICEFIVNNNQPYVIKDLLSV